jgi:hypothetical protein
MHDVLSGATQMNHPHACTSLHGCRGWRPPLVDGSVPGQVTMPAALDSSQAYGGAPTLVPAGYRLGARPGTTRASHGCGWRR